MLKKNRRPTAGRFPKIQPAQFPKLDNLELFNQMIDKITDELVLIANDGKICYANEAMASGLGYSQKAVLSKNILEFFKDKMTLDQWRRTYFQPLKQKKRPQTYEIQRVVKSGQVQTLQVTAVYMQYQGNEYILSIGRDSTEKLTIERSLKESKERYQLISERAADGIFIVDLKGRINYANHALAELVGISLKVAQGTHFKKYITSQSLPKAIECFQKAKSGQARIHEEIQIVDGHGNTIPVEVSVSPLYKDGKIFEIHAIIRDIRRRKYLENLLKESERKYRDLFEEANDALVIVDCNGNILDANRQAENLFKRSKIELIGSHQSVLYPNQQTQAYKDFWQKTISGESRAFDLEIMRKDGEIVPVSVLCRCIEVMGRKVFLGRFTDLSERKKSEEKIQESNKMAAINLFVSGTAHEIKRPLEVMLTHLKSTLEKYQDRDFEYIGFKEFAHIMGTMQSLHDQVEHCYDIANKLLSFSKKKAGITKSGCHVNVIIKSSADLFTQEFKKSNIRVVSHLAQKIPLAAIGVIEWGEVTKCILENSLQAMSSGGTIAIRSFYKRDEDSIHVEFKDDGVGIPKENLPRVFEPFFTTKQRTLGQSAGLGLAMVYSIIEECKGDITVKSSLGHGTLIKIILPVFKNHNHFRK